MEVLNFYYYYFLYKKNLFPALEMACSNYLPNKANVVEAD